MSNALTPEQQSLEDQLCDLAGWWRVSFDDPVWREVIRVAYLDVLNQLLSSGWARVLDIECELPSDFMPANYKARYEHDYPDWPPLDEQG